MLTQAQWWLARLDFSEQVKLLAGDVRLIPFSSARFDATWIGFKLELFSSREIAQELSDSRRDFVPNGRLCVLALAKPSKRNWGLPVGIALANKKWQDRSSD